MHMYKHNLLFHNAIVNQIGLTGKHGGRVCTICSILLLLTKTALGTSSLSSPGHVSLIGNFPPLSLSQPLCLILTFDNNCNQRQSCFVVKMDRKKLSLSRQMSCPGFALTICRLQTPRDWFSSLFLLQSESETQLELDPAPS